MTISYNLPNFGEIKVNLYGKAKELYELLDEVGLIDKLKITQQLGSIRFAFQDYTIHDMNMLCCSFI